MQRKQSSQSASLMLMKIVVYTDKRGEQVTKAVDALFSEYKDFEWFSQESKNPLGCFKLLILPSGLPGIQRSKQHHCHILPTKLSSHCPGSRKQVTLEKITFDSAHYTFVHQQGSPVSQEKLTKEYNRRIAALSKQNSQYEFLLVWRLINMGRDNDYFLFEGKNCKLNQKTNGINFISEQISEVPNSVRPNQQIPTNNFKEPNQLQSAAVKMSNVKSFEYFGLPNIGNTCYMNSALQCLLHTDKLTQQFTQQFKKKSVNKERQPLLFAYSKLFRVMQQGRVDTITMEQLKHVIETKNSSFRGFTQNDTQMLLLTILDTFMDELKPNPDAQYEMIAENQEISEKDQSEQFWKKENNYSKSFVSELFRGQLRCQLSCCECSQVLQSTFDPFLIVQLQVETPIERQNEDRPKVDKMNQIIQINLYYVANSWKSQVACYTVRASEESTLGQAVNELVKHWGLKIAPIVMIYDKDNMFQECVDITQVRIKEVSQCKQPRVYVYSQITSSNRWETPTFVQYKFKGKIMSQGRYLNVDDDSMRREYPPFGVIEQYFNRVTNGQSFREAYDYYQFHQQKTQNGFRRMLIQLKKEVVFNVPSRTSTTVFQLANIGNSTTANNYRFSPRHPSPSPPPPCKLMDCLNTFSASTVVSSLPDNLCKKCNQKQPTNMKIDLYRAGEILIFALGRFDLRTGFKSMRKVEFPFQLDLTGKQSQKIHHTAQTSSATYRLYAVINHYGSFSFGHYTAVCCLKGGWYSFNENYVSRVEKCHVVTEDAYVLFYERYH